MVVLLLAGRAAGQVPGWDSRWPSPQKVFEGCDPQTLREFQKESAALTQNPRDEEALVNRGVYGLRLAKTSRYDYVLLWLAAKDLETAIKLDPKDFAAWHNYGDVNYSAGDNWMANDHSNARRALDAFNHALALNPKSARSYMGRGWAYYELNDQAHAQTDFQRALQLDPSLRADIQKEIGNIQERHRQANGAKGTLEQMSRYYVERSAHNANECSRFRCFWTEGECRCSMALDPGR